jgi:hypothetical protein
LPQKFTRIKLTGIFYPGRLSELPTYPRQISIMNSPAEMNPTMQCTAFDGPIRIASGPLSAVALAVKAAVDRGAKGPVLAYDDATGRAVDIDTRGTSQDVLARLDAGGGEPGQSAAPRGRGRPRLGVVAREVTLLPRHWEWLGAQPGGASVALRKLVEAASRNGSGRQREMHEAAYRFMTAMAGDMPGFEEAIRALFANDAKAVATHAAPWPVDIREHALALGFGAA